MYAKNASTLDRQAGFLRVAGASAAEICIGGQFEGNERMDMLAEEEHFFDGVPFRSMHLPAVLGIIHPDDLHLTQYLFSRQQVSVALTHPVKVNGEYPLDQYERLISAGIVLAIENMDGQQSSGHAIEELKAMMDAFPGLRFVLDVQHAFEHDPVMGYARELLSAMQGRISHLHVSGEVPGNCHALVHLANNKKEILGFVSEIIAVERFPIILEGEYRKRGELRREVDLINEELGFAA